MTHFSSCYFTSKFGNPGWFLPKSLQYNFEVILLFLRTGLVLQQSVTSFSPVECALYLTETPLLFGQMMLSLPSKLEAVIDP